MSFRTAEPALSPLLEMIEGATGKAVSGRESEETINAFGGTLL